MHITIVVPSVDVESSKYCRSLTDIFLVTQPQKVNISDLFNSQKDAIQEVTAFRNKLLSYIKNFGHINELSAIISYCNILIQICECMASEKYNDSELIYEMLITLYECSGNILIRDGIAKNSIEVRMKEKLTPDEITAFIGEINYAIESTIFPIVKKLYHFAFKLGEEAKIDFNTAKKILPTP